MPKVVTTTGTGMTQRGVVEFEWAQPGDAEAHVRAAITGFERTSFAHLSARLAGLATSILDEAGLPSNPEGEYLVTPDGTWAAITEEMDLGPELEDARHSLEVAVMYCRVPADSSQGYAARVLRTLSQARQELEAGHFDEAMALAFAAGELVTEAAMKGVFELDFLAGEKVRSGGREGNVKAYGTEAEKTARRASYLAAFDRLRAQGVGIMEAYDMVAKEARVSPRTVRRAVEQRNDRA